MSRIVVFTGHTSMKVGGIESHMANVAAARAGDILFVENDPASVPDTVRAFFAEHGVELHPEPLRTRPPGALHDIYDVIKKNQPEIVHANFQPVSYMAAIIARLLGVKKVIWTKHSRLLIERFSPTWWYHYVAMLFVDRVICVSNAVDEELRRLSLGDNKRTVIPLGVDLSRFNTAPVGAAEDAPIRRELGIDDGDFVVTVVAQIRPEKKLDTFVHAIRILVQEEQMANVKALIVGGVFPNEASRRVERELRRLVESSGLSDHVRFLDVREDIRLIYAVSHLAGLTSATEGLPLALVEAAAVGLPLFGTNAGGTPEIVIDNRNGLLFEPGKPEQLAQVVKTIAADDELRRRFGERSRAIAEEKYDMKRGIESLSRLYDPPEVRFGR